MTLDIDIIYIIFINRHLYEVGLMSELVEDEQLDVNFLLRQSLITISTLPFHLVNDLWRWRAFREDNTLICGYSDTFPTG